jgi:hypothetical protein
LTRFVEGHDGLVDEFRVEAIAELLPLYQ